jgi:putative restriction endonuclease
MSERASPPPFPWKLRSVVRLWVANTDPDWFDFLSDQPGLDEVNFWQPSGQMSFRAVEPGDLFVFRLKSPRNAIGGYGVFFEASTLPVSLAWDVFGTSNGVSTYADMRNQIGRYRNDPNPRLDYQIGCRVLVSPVFFPPELWLPQPPSWSGSIVVGKTYDTETREGMSIWEGLQRSQELWNARSPAVPNRLGERRSTYNAPEERFGQPTKIVPRLGQGAFRVGVLEAYNRECALSGGRVLPALDAAHIIPFGEGGSHELSNGILLRKDIHSVFDAGYATFDDDFRLVVSNRVKTEFNNGNEYLRLKGERLKLPKQIQLRPSLDNIRWHQNNRYVD